MQKDIPIIHLSARYKTAMPIKKWFTINTILLALFFTGSFTATVFAQHDSVKTDSMVVKFYAENHDSLFWFPQNNNVILSIKNWFYCKGLGRAKQWLDEIESSAGRLGIIVPHEQISEIRAVLLSKIKIDDSVKVKTDTLITNVVLHFIKDLEQGSSSFNYDGISVNHDSLYISQLRRPRFLTSVSAVISSLDCKDHDYKVYKKFLKDSVSIADSLKCKTIICAMNYRRFISTNCQSEFILVNIPQTEAVYFRNGKCAIQMRIVVGKKTKQTPTIASYITSITTFPNWNVPHQIAVDEILPKVQKNENYLEQNNYEVVDANGNEIDDSELNWNDINANNFTFFFRQSSGSENALGVVKFNLQDPFSIFLHGTSNQKTFSRDFRFLSHGCVRLEKPFELADSLLEGKLDIEDLKTGKTEKEPEVLLLHNKLQTYIIYSPVRIDGERVTFLKDEYGLIK